MMMLQREFKQFDFVKLFWYIKEDYRKLRPDFREIEIAQLTIEALWNGINLFFVNGLVNIYSFPTMEHLDFNVSLKDTVQYMQNLSKERVKCKIFENHKKQEKAKCSRRT
jgi:hypothetical protein